MLILGLVVVVALATNGGVLTNAKPAGQVEYVSSSTLGTAPSGAQPAPGSSASASASASSSGASTASSGPAASASTDGASSASTVSASSASTGSSASTSTGGASSASTGSVASTSTGGASSASTESVGSASTGGAWTASARPAAQSSSASGPATVKETLYPSQPTPRTLGQPTRGQRTQSTDIFNDPLFYLGLDHPEYMLSSLYGSDLGLGPNHIQAPLNHPAGGASNDPLSGSSSGLLNGNINDPLNGYLHDPFIDPIYDPLNGPLGDMIVDPSYGTVYFKPNDRFMNHSRRLKATSCPGISLWPPLLPAAILKTGTRSFDPVFGDFGVPSACSYCTASFDNSPESFIRNIPPLTNPRQSGTARKGGQSNTSGRSTNTLQDPLASPLPMDPLTGMMTDPLIPQDVQHPLYSPLSYLNFK